MKNGIRKKIPFILGILTMIASLAFSAQSVEASNVVVDQRNGYYFARGDEPVGFDTPVPEGAENNNIDITDAFSLPGVYNSSSIYDRNNAYTSNERTNVLVLYNGLTGEQKSSLWYQQQLNLNYPFEFEAFVYLGNANDASSPGIGDGITFTLQRDPALQLAIGGTGGGIGVFPNLRTSPNMIYNALSVEMDTYFNNDNNLSYDRELLGQPWNLQESLAWPHLGMGTTATSGNLHPQGATVPTAYVFDNFTHRGVTHVTTAEEQKAWFNKWVKLNVSWTPNGTAGDFENIETGNLSYTWGPVYDETGAVQSYRYNTQTWPDINIDATFNSEPFNGAAWEIPWTKEERNVTWGFTGSNYLYGNPFGVMITKLPNEPDIEVNRTVRNTSVSGEAAGSYTQAEPGDVLEYTVRIENVSDNGTPIPLRNTQIVEDLQDNTWNGAFNYSNSLPSAVNAPTPTMDGTNFTFTDGQNLFEPGNWFEYSYEVVVGADTTEFINDVEISSTYSSLLNAGETNVTVYPEGINLAKSVSDSNPKVGDTVEVNLDLTATTGISVVDEINDAIPTGFELVANSTKLTVYDGTKTTTKGSETLNDNLWSGSTDAGHTFALSVDTDLTNQTLKDLMGGSVHNNLISLSYQIKPTVARKGEADIALGAAISSSTNKVNGVRGILTYPATSNDINLTVKTDLIFNFLDEEGQPLTASMIESIHPSFGGKNPVVFYLNTGDAYDYSSTIAEITGKLFTNENLSLYRVDTNSASGSLTDISGNAVKDGTVIDLYYGSKAVLTVEFVNDIGQVLSGHTITVGEAPTNTIQADIYVGSVVDLTSPTYQKVQDKIDELIRAGYASVTPPSNESNIVINNITQTVQYTVAGQLVLQSYPKTIDFGTLTFNGQAQRVEDPLISDQLIIADTRSDTSKGWSLKVAVSSPMYNASTNSYMHDALRYVKGTDDEEILTADAKEIYSETVGGKGLFNVTSTWGTTEGSNGLKLVADPAKTTNSDIGRYTGEITWTIESAPL